MSDDAMGDEVYQPDRSGTDDPPNDPDLENALEGDGLDETLDEGYSPPEKPLAAEHHGTTAREQREGESLEQRLTEEEPDIAPPESDGIGDQAGTNSEALNEEAGNARTGRLVTADDGPPPHTNTTAARDIGTDSGAASAEETALHTTPTPDEREPQQEQGKNQSNGHPRNT
ncbi:DUF5709 domain-containing protein [Streptomyces syringium]|uniref:DUF5709 domain-containing protein n=1 Tax=Streptomyces syringium TaxID=76729 RepID=UPI003455523B